MVTVKVFYDPLAPLSPEMMELMRPKALIERAKLREIAGQDLTGCVRQVNTTEENGQKKNG